MSRTAGGGERVVAIAKVGSLEGVRSAILAWYDVEHRDFPWRGLRDPYAVLVSEVMLQQTQASRVAERFGPFMERFGSADALGGATPAAVLTEWSGLGYNRRARSLQHAAAIVARHGWPTDLAGLERLPGVGPYTARAVSSLAFGTPVGVVDTNVRRWLLRRFDVADRPAELQALADALATAPPPDRAADWTHATMEFGATVCRSRAPCCNACPIAAECPSRDAAARVPVPRQPPLPGSDRAYRGAVLRELTTAGGHSMRSERLRVRLARAMARIGPPLDDAGWSRVLAGLERDGLVHRHGKVVRLGAATIGR
jgi:A/G-specific adenine glycosylase